MEGCAVSLCHSHRPYRTHGVPSDTDGFIWFPAWEWLGYMAQLPALQTRQHTAIERCAGIGLMVCEPIIIQLIGLGIDLNHNMFVEW